MREWILGMIVNLIVTYLKDGTVQDAAHKIRAVVIPFLHEQKDELIKRLRVEASKTENNIDDAVVDTLEVFLTELLPTTAQCAV